MLSGWKFSGESSVLGWLGLERLLGLQPQGKLSPPVGVPAISVMKAHIFILVELNTPSELFGKISTAGFRIVTTDRRSGSKDIGESLGTPIIQGVKISVIMFITHIRVTTYEIIHFTWTDPILASWKRLTTLGNWHPQTELSSWHSSGMTLKGDDSYQRMRRGSHRARNCKWIDKHTYS